MSLGNPRLGFVCTAQTTDGQHGLAGYFQEYDRDLGPDERLVFSPGEQPPPFDPTAAPVLPEAQWPAERRAKAARNYAMEYVRSGLPRLAEVFGPAEAAHLGRVTGQLVGAQMYHATAAGLDVAGNDLAAFGRWLVAWAHAEGDTAVLEVEPGSASGRDVGSILVRRTGWRLMRGIDHLPSSVFEGWNGLVEGALAVHNRFLVLEVGRRIDWGDGDIVWRIRPRGPA